MPLVTGTAIFFAWLWLRWVGLMLAGFATIYAGLVLFGVGSLCLLIHVATSRRCRPIGFWQTHKASVVAGTLLVFNFPVAAAYTVRASHLDEIQRGFERGQNDLNSQIKSLRSGETDSIYLYDTRRTDELLHQLAGMPEVESLQLDLTDATDDGMHHVASLPKLRKLVLYGGRPGVSGVGLAHLRDLKSLETLELINTHVTDSGLKSLDALVSLRSLTLFNDFGNRKPYLTDEALTDLRGLSNLESLHLGGTWFTEGAVDELRRDLPHCTITTGDYRRATNQSR